MVDHLERSSFLNEGIEALLNPLANPSPFQSRQGCEFICHNQKVNVSFEFNFSVPLSQFDDVSKMGLVSVEAVIESLKTRLKLLETKKTQMVLAQKSLFHNIGTVVTNRIPFKEGEQIHLTQLLTVETSPVNLKADTSRSRKKRKQACASCRASKVHCSGTFPCERCTQRQIECYFSAPKKRGRRFTENSEQQPTQFESSNLSQTVVSNQMSSLDVGMEPSSSNNVSLVENSIEMSFQRDGDEEISIFSDLPAFDTNALNDLLQEIPSSIASHTDRQSDSRFSYMDVDRRPLRSLEVTISFFRYHMLKRLNDPQKKDHVQKLLEDSKKLIRHYNILDWKSFSIYTALTLRDTVTNENSDHIEDPIAIWSTTGVLLVFNIAMYVMLGWNPEEMYNKDEHPHRGPLHITRPEDISSLLDEQFRALQDWKIQDYSVMLRVKNKSGAEIKTMVYVDIKRNPAGVPILFVGRFYPKFDNFVHISPNKGQE